MAYNLDHYGDEYTPYIVPLSGNVVDDSNSLINTIFTPIKYNVKENKNNIKNFALKHINFYKSLLENETKRQ